MRQTNEKEELPWDIITILVKDLKNGVTHENQQQEDPRTISSDEEGSAVCQNSTDTSSQHSGDSTPTKKSNPAIVTPEKRSASDRTSPFECSEEETLSESSDDEAEWNRWYEELIGFEKEYGHVEVTDAYPENKALSIWVKRQRRVYASLKEGQERTERDQDRILKLEALGFDWRPDYISYAKQNKPFFTEKWKLRYKELLEFGMKNGHVNVPHTFPENKQLARWVKRQRIQYKRFKEGKLPLINLSLNQERIDKLELVGFVWDSHELTWRENLDALKDFHAEFGHCNVSMGYKANKQLGIWVKTQRRQYKLFQEGKRSSIDSNRVKVLNEMGFEWKLRDRRSKACFVKDAVAA